MKRTLLTGLLLILLCCCETYAQRQFRKPLKSSNQSMLGFSNYNIGLKIGCPWSYMTKSDLRETTHDGHFGYSGGITAERNLGKWSIGLEGTYAQKGTKMHNKKPYQMSVFPMQEGILKTQYEVVYNVVTIRVPFTYYFKGMIGNDALVPYLFAGPEVDIPLGKSEAIITRFDGPTGENPLPGRKEPFTPCLNAGAVAGIGLMTRVRFENSAIFLKFDAAYNRGLMNLAVPTKEAWKWPFGHQEKRIFAHDVEINLSVVYPIKKILHDACYNFRTKK